MAYLSDKIHLRVFILIGVLLLPVVSDAEFTVDGKAYGRLPKSFPDQYQCSSRKQVGTVGVLSEDSAHLIQAVASYDSDGVREISGVISEQSALSEAQFSKFLVANSMPPISAEGRSGFWPQGQIWNSVAATNVVAHQGESQGGFIGMGFGGAGYNNSTGMFGSMAMGYSGDLKKKCSDESCSPQTVGSISAAFFGETEAKDTRPGIIAGQTERPGDIAGKTKKAGDIMVNAEIRKQRDLTPEKNVDVASVATRPGDLAALRLRPGDVAGKTKRPGDIAAEKIKPGEKSGWDLKEGEKSYWDSKMKNSSNSRNGENIGKKGITTFTALLDREGNLKKLVYRSGTDILKTISSESIRRDRVDPLVALIQSKLGKIKTYASCCKNDSKRECDTIYRPEIKMSQPIQSASKSEEFGKAGYNPFGKSSGGAR